MESNSDIDSGEEDRAYTGLLRSQLLDKCVTLLSEEGVAVTTGVIRASQPSNCVDSTQLGPNDVGVFILESNGHNAVFDDWRFSVRRWPLSKKQYDGVSLLCIIRKHDQDNLNSVSTRLSLRQYNSTRRRRVMCTTRIERKLCENSIYSVASENCCPMRCMQYFPREAIRAVRTEMWSIDHALRKHMKLQVHRNTYEVDGSKVLLLEGHEVCLIAWSIIHSVSRADFYRFKRYSIHGMCALYHGNRGTKKQWIATPWPP
jgi:hypothetical protein